MHVGTMMLHTGAREADGQPKSSGTYKIILTVAEIYYRHSDPVME